MITKLLRITTPTSCAVAILTQTGSAWTVERNAPSLSWMRGLDMPAIKQKLQADGAKWEWLPVSAQFAQVAQGHQPTRQRPTRPTKATPAANVTEGEQAWFNGVQNAIKAEQRKAAIVRNARTKRKTVTDNA